jgi:hypothetical protein
MALNYKTGNLARSAAANALTARLNSGTIAIRTGTPPTNVADASSGTLLGTCTFGATAFGAASSGVATANSITSDTSADNSGTAGYFRTYGSGASDTAADGQGTAGVSADTTDMTFDNKVIVAGGTIAISSMTLTVPIQ